MRGATLLILCALLTGCDRSEEQRVPRFSDAEMRQFRASFPGMTEACLHKLQWEGIAALSDKSDECFSFEQPRRWKGLWRKDFEGSRFCPEPARECSHDTAGEETWLEFSFDYPAAGEPPFGGLYAVEFIGRRSKGAGAFGHAGMFKNEILVDRLVSLKEVEPPPRG